MPRRCGVFLLRCFWRPLHSGLFIRTGLLNNALCNADGSENPIRKIALS